MSPDALHRRRFTAVALAAAAGIAVPALRAQGRVEKARVTIAVRSKAAFDVLPLTIAQELGYFQAEGIDVEVAELGSDARVLQALASGGADVVSAAYEHTIQLQSRNQMLQAFVLQGRAPAVAMGVSTRAIPSYRGIADLRGRRIAIAAPGSSTGIVASLVLARAGLKASDVTFVAVGTGAGALTAMRTGQVDAVSYGDPVMTMLEQRGEVKIIGDTRTLKGTQDVFGGPMPAGCLLASQDFVQKHPNACQAMTNAIVHSLKWLQTAGPSDLIKAVPDSYLLGDRALYLASFGKIREAIAIDGTIPEEGARTALKVLAAFDPAIRPERIALGRTFTNDFVRRAKDKFRA